MTRAARERRVFYVEEPLFDAAPGAESVDVQQPAPGVYVAVPHLAPGSSESRVMARQRHMLDDLIHTFGIAQFVLWYWTPMAVPFTRHLDPAAVVFDCMDELSAFAGAPPVLRQLERELLARADLVFTGGHSLYEAKRTLHADVHAFPSSVDVAHFARALSVVEEPPDQRQIPRPRLGFFGVIDERLDIALIDGVARARRDWQFVLLGPTAKIDPATLPRHRNIHYLGMKSYDQLPDYLAGWDVALLPFARNDATRFISPTKTPEYLAAGRPVVSTSIRDVVRPYGELGLVHIADSVEAFIAGADAAMQEDADLRRARVAARLSGSSWDTTWAHMDTLIAAHSRQEDEAVPVPTVAPVPTAAPSGRAAQYNLPSALAQGAPESPHDV
jgi:glycosyltransferase involved in cell wall biosynthesis